MCIARRSENVQKVSKGDLDYTLLLITESLIISFYAALLYATSYNTWNYVIKQKRYTKFLVAVFYVLMMATLVCRVGAIICYLVVNLDETKVSYETGDQFKIYAVYIKIIADSFQYVSMVELTMMVKLAARRFRSEREVFEVMKEKKKKHTRVYALTGVICLSLLVCCGFESYQSNQAYQQHDEDLCYQEQFMFESIKLGYLSLLCLMMGIAYCDILSTLNRHMKG